MLRGVVLILLSALCFALSTVSAKIVNSSSEISAFELTFFRFALGLAVMIVYVVVRKKPLRPNKPNLVVLRSVFNTAAVIFFYMGIQRTTVTKSNLLNMTYPVFVFLLAPFLNREKTPSRYFMYLLLSMGGLYLVVVPDSNMLAWARINAGDLYSLISGLLAGFAIITLRESRKFDESYMILFYLMLLGFLMNLPFVVGNFIVPEGRMLFHCLASAATAFLGQMFITEGYRHIDASAGSLVSASRIIFAGLLGVIIFADPLSLRIAAGGILILLSLAGVSGFGRKKDTMS